MKIITLIIDSADAEIIQNSLFARREETRRCLKSPSDSVEKSRLHDAHQRILSIEQQIHEQLSR